MSITNTMTLYLLSNWAPGFSNRPLFRRMLLKIGPNTYHPNEPFFTHRLSLYIAIDVMQERRALLRQLQLKLVSKNGGGEVRNVCLLSVLSVTELEFRFFISRIPLGDNGKLQRNQSGRLVGKALLPFRFKHIAPSV